MLRNNGNLIFLAGFVAISALAVAGWLRKPELPVTDGFAASSAGAPTPEAGYQPTGYQPQTSPVADRDGYFASIDRPIYVHSARVSDTYEQSAQPADYMAATPRRTRYVSRYSNRRAEKRHGRSTGKSVAIVAGSAGAGAAIGAIAGGGKGAGIGALAGGGTGFVYDRLTHNH